jgi:hypothetical protein
MKAISMGGISGRFIVFVVAVCLTGCASRFPQVAEDAAHNGADRIAGRAYLVVLPSKREKNCEDILLVPHKYDYDRAIVSAFGESKTGLARDGEFADTYADLGNQKDVKSADCDDKGQFEFSHLAEGDYYLIARSTWLLRLAHRGGYFLKEITVSGDEDEVLVSTTVAGG